jgi:hypothetical protein
VKDTPASHRPDEATYLDLSVGNFGLAIVARAVVTVQQDVAVASHVEVRGAPAPLYDLGALVSGAQRPRVPFMIGFEAGGRIAAVGVDRVGHLRHHEKPRLSQVPTFALTRPDLFEGALHDGERLLIVLRPQALADLTVELAQRI